MSANNPYSSSSKLNNNIKVFAEAIHTIIEDLPAEAIEKVFTEISQDMAEDARARVPVRYGYLKKAIGTRVRVYHSKVSKKKNKVVWAGVGVRRGMWGADSRGKVVKPEKYAKFHAKPALNAAFEAHKDKIYPALEAEFWRQLAQLQTVNTKVTI